MGLDLASLIGVLAQQSVEAADTGLDGIGLGRVRTV